MNKVTRPEWLKIGAVVRVQFWVGVVRDIAETEAGKLFVWVYGPKNAAYGQLPECLEFSPEHIRLATGDEIAKDVAMYWRRMGMLIAEVEKINDEVSGHA